MGILVGVRAAALQASLEGESTKNAGGVKQSNIWRAMELLQVDCLAPRTVAARYLSEEGDQG
jgi:hypothetical protein